MLEEAISCRSCGVSGMVAFGNRTPDLMFANLCQLFIIYTKGVWSIGRYIGNDTDTWVMTFIGQTSPGCIPLEVTDIYQAFDTMDHAHEPARNLYTGYRMTGLTAFANILVARFR